MSIAWICYKGSKFVNFKFFQKNMKYYNKNRNLLKKFGCYLILVYLSLLLNKYFFK